MNLRLFRFALLTFTARRKDPFLRLKSRRSRMDAMDRKLFGRLVLIGFIKNLTLSIAGMIDCSAVGRSLGAAGHSAMKLAMRVFLSRNRTLYLRLRDDCRRFDLTERYRMIRPDDPSKNIGLRLVFANADEVQYSSAMNLNNVCVRYVMPQDRSGQQK